MPTFQLVGLPPESFAHLNDFSHEELLHRGVRRVVADTKPGYPCRVSLVDAEVGEELYLLPFEHQTADSPYRASGPIFVRCAALQTILPTGEVPEYVRLRLISLRAYDDQHMMIDAQVCEGSAVAGEIERHFANQSVSYMHLHNAKRGCFSCLARRAPAASEA